MAVDPDVEELVAALRREIAELKAKQSEPLSEARALTVHFDDGSTMVFRRVND